MLDACLNKFELNLMIVIPFYRSVRLWALSGEQLLEFVGHIAIVYSVASHSSGDIASRSEDGFAKIWRGIFIFISYFAYNKVEEISYIKVLSYRFCDFG